MFDHFECVKVELHDGIAYVRMNRPEKRNAMNPRLHDEMEEALTHLEVDPDAKVIVDSRRWRQFLRWTGPQDVFPGK